MAARLCAIHRELGTEPARSACRQFPRVVLQRTARHAASRSRTSARRRRTCFSPRRRRVRRSSRRLHTWRSTAMPKASTPATTLPPLLRPGMLTDATATTPGNARLATLDRGDATADAGARAHRCRDADAVRVAAGRRHPARDRRPGSSTLRPTVKPDEDLAGNRRAVARLARALGATRALRSPRAARRRDGRHWRGARRMVGEIRRPVRAYLAARLFGNWVAYHGRACTPSSSICASPCAVVKMEAVRRRARGASSSPWQTVTRSRSKRRPAAGAPVRT